MSRNLNLNGMLYFEAVARHGRVSKAAEELAVSPSAVSQQIKFLEQQYGIRLFRRDKRRLSLTLDGERLYQTTSAAFRMLREARHIVSRQRENRQLIMRASPSFGVRWLGPRLADFIAQHPHWDLRIDAAPDPTDFEREVVDLDLRYGSGDWPGLYLEPILFDYVLPMCSPPYRDWLHRQCSSGAEMIRSSRLIDSVKTLYQWDYWLARQHIAPGEHGPSLRFDRSSMALQMALRGIGVVLESVTLSHDELSSGSLVPVCEDLEVICFPAYWMVSPSRHQSRRVVKIFRTWLHQQAADHDRQATDLLDALGCTTTRFENVSLVDGQVCT